MPGGARSGRCSRTGVLGNALLAPSTMPLPLPSFPSSAGNAISARIELPPFRPRSSPLPGANTSGSASASNRAKCDDLLLAQAARRRRTRHRPRARRRHELVEPEQVRGDERVVECTDPFQFRRQRPRQQNVGSGQRCQMQVGLLGDLGAQRIDHHQLPALALRLPDAAYQMQVGDSRVVAPHHVQLRVRGELRRAAGNGAIGAGPRLAAHAAAHRAAIELRRAKLVEEARRHAVAGEHPVRTGIVQRRHRRRPPALDHVTGARVDFVERRVPA